MADFFSTLTSILLKVGIVAFFANEVRGVVLAGPVLYAMYRAGGDVMALWIGFCSLVGIAISVVAPVLIVRKFKLFPARAN